VKIKIASHDMANPKGAKRRYHLEEIPPKFLNINHALFLSVLVSRMENLESSG